nr:hypothetical protein GCM10020185_61720 [Pseudomonas brassicacearum subsp. brassicacearum]
MSNVEPHLHALTLNHIYDGFKQLIPISLFVVVFGVAFGLAAAQTGLSDTSAVLMSTLVFLPALLNLPRWTYGASKCRSFR